LLAKLQRPHWMSVSEFTRLADAFDMPFLRVRGRGIGQRGYSTKIEAIAPTLHGQAGGQYLRRRIHGMTPAERNAMPLAFAVEASRGAWSAWSECRTVLNQDLWWSHRTSDETLSIFESPAFQRIVPRVGR